MICLILKYLKTEQLSQINKEDEDKDKEKEYNLSGNTNIDENNFINNNADSFNFIKKSQERWKEEI